MLSQTLDRSWIMATEPETLRKYYEAIASGKCRAGLWVVGPTSTGKTEIARSVFDFVLPEDTDPPMTNLARNALYLDGGASPIELFKHIYKHRNRTIIIDDPSTDFLRTPDGRRLWKQLFSTVRQGGKIVKNLTWLKQNPSLEAECVPQSYQTTGAVIAITNRVGPIDRDMGAIIARCLHVFYAPDLPTRLEYARTWVDDEVVLRHLWSLYLTGKMKRLHQRDIFQSLEFRKNPELADWRKYLEQVCTQEEYETADPRQDASLIREWVTQHTDCGVFTPSTIYKNMRTFRDDRQRLDQALKYGLKQGIIHPITPKRPRGSRIRLPEVVYALGSGSRLSPLSNSRKVTKVTTGRSKNLQTA